MSFYQFLTCFLLFFSNYCNFFLNDVRCTLSFHGKWCYNNDNNNNNNNNDNINNNSDNNNNNNNSKNNNNIFLNLKIIIIIIIIIIITILIIIIIIIFNQLLNFPFCVIILAQFLLTIGLTCIYERHLFWRKCCGEGGMPP